MTHRCNCKMLACLSGLLTLLLWSGAPAVTQETKPNTADAAKQDKKPAGDLVPLELKLPKPAFKGTPENVPPGTRLEPPRKGPRPDLMVPPGTVLVSRGMPVTASDNEPIIGAIKCVTDGDREANEGSYVELGPGRQWVQIDLKKKVAIQAVLIWHYHSTARVYHDVVVQVADDEDFITNVRTVFNNDHDNSSGLGLGKEYEYWETFEGKLIDAKGVVARYIRLYSNGSTADDQNHYTEVDIYGKPPK
ncbi:MAG: hypothetical protein PVJ57_16975 [Phycisphaerae bacterium]|jgi:hypothetical protein